MPPRRGEDQVQRGGLRGVRRRRRGGVDHQRWPPRADLVASGFFEEARMPVVFGRRIKGAPDGLADDLEDVAGLEVGQPLEGLESCYTVHDKSY